MTDYATRDVPVVPEADAIGAAKAEMRSGRRQGLAALNAVFRAGRVPDPAPDGPYRGEVVALDIAPIVTTLVEWLTSLMMPWQGKFLVASDARGDNIFGARWKTLLRMLYPRYRGNRDYGSDRFRAFVFDTSIAPGNVDADRRVFRIDYDRPDNPPLTIRRIVDEIVEVDDGVYLGKVHFRWWWGTWQMIGYFALRK